MERRHVLTEHTQFPRQFWKRSEGIRRVGELCLEYSQMSSKGTYYCVVHAPKEVGVGFLSELGSDNRSLGVGRDSHYLTFSDADRLALEAKVCRMVGLYKEARWR